jgi:hypothetical protein
MPSSSVPALSTYESCLSASERIRWRVEDFVGGESRFDFTRAFLPESLARVEPLRFLSPVERLTLNHIRAHAYLGLLGLFEELILPFILDHVRPRLRDDDVRTRAFLSFANEEAKHIHLFKRCREEFERGFGSPCGLIGPAPEIAREVLSHDALAVALVILQAEWMTQRHYVESVQDDRNLDLHFKNLLRHHWMEEAQHARLDAMMVAELAENASPLALARAVEEYLDIVRVFEEAVSRQVDLDLESFARATGRELDGEERAAFLEVQLQANRWTYLGSGMTHAEFLGSVGRLGTSLRERVEGAAEAFLLRPV